MASELRKLQLFKVTRDPAEIKPDALYLVKPEGENSFDLKAADSGGVLLPLKCCGGDGVAYKSYTAILLQPGAEKPFITGELQNDFGQSMEFEYTRPGFYKGIMPGVFKGKVIIFCNAYHSGEGFPRAAAARVLNEDEIEIACSEDDNYINLDVRVYP